MARWSGHRTVLELQAPRGKVWVRLAGPYKQLKNYRPQEWNEIEITVKDGVAHSLCDGEVLEAAMKVPASGPIGVEGDRGQMEYRRIRIRESAAGTP